MLLNFALPTSRAFVILFLSCLHFYASEAAGVAAAAATLKEICEEGFLCIHIFGIKFKEKFTLSCI